VVVKINNRCNSEAINQGIDGVILRYD